ncbi:peptidoglycan editing factor PgeF [Qipengyuania sediminis]|uniref:peptidoglycan editing factor PgeF n=1 Tax=Qipengyuania sediminis TaxID=1532023 RepID=UPI00105A260C|nr:peptidoglycan editing factor PgeF [Qipengyuania sediminis]
MTLRARNLAGLPHAFSTREPLEPAEILPGAQLVLARQIHSPVTVTVSGSWPGAPPAADALVTATPGLLIGIVTADCAPVLLADHAAGVVGAAHAGWRGAAGGVIANTVAAMEALGARRSRIAAAIGPAIAQESYEVDAAMRDHFAPEADRFFASGTSGRWQFDLPGFVAAALATEGVDTIADLAEDTYAQPERFFSYRRASHRREPTGGRQTSVIGCG